MQLRFVTITVTDGSRLGRAGGGVVRVRRTARSRAGARHRFSRMTVVAGLQGSWAGSLRLALRARPGHGQTGSDRQDGYAVRLEPGVARDHSEVLDQCLSNQYAVERITVMALQCTGHQSMLNGYGQG